MKDPDPCYSEPQTWSSFSPVDGLSPVIPGTTVHHETEVMCHDMAKKLIPFQQEKKAPESAPLVMRHTPFVVRLLGNRYAFNVTVCAKALPLQRATVTVLKPPPRIMVDASVPALARVRAADRILERTNQGVENEDIEVRVAALEQTARQRP